MSVSRLPARLLFAAILAVVVAVPARAQIQIGQQAQCVEECGGGGGSFTITPDGDPLTVPANSTGQQAVFDVWNATTSFKSVSFSCVSTGPVTCTGVNPSSYVFDANEATFVTVTYSTSGAGSGTVSLVASGGASEQGWYSLSVIAPGPPTLALRNQNGDNLDRSMCLTSGAGEAAAWQCGDLLVSHGTPGYATMGKTRSLTLVYNSATEVPRPAVAVAVSQYSSQAVPSGVSAALQVKTTGGSYVSVANATYLPWSAGTRQLVLAYTDTLSASGIYPFRFIVSNQYASGNLADTVSGNLLLVNRAGSKFGRGWSLAGVEELVLQQPVGTTNGDIMWIGGEGSSRWYTKLNATTWVAPSGVFRDTLVYDAQSTTYTRTLRYGIQVVYDGQGHHIQTVNRTGQKSVFSWTSGKLTSISVPPQGVSGNSYTITYLAGGDFDKITDPAGRITDGTLSSGRLVSMMDPDTTVATQFAYDNAGRMTTRTSRPGFVTRYFYDKGLRVTRVLVPGALVAGDTTVFQPWDEVGLAVAGTGQTAVDTSLAYTRILGPRVGVADNATFRVDRWGAPVKITDPLNRSTTLLRGDASHPALLTRVTFPNGRIGLMSYNSRGNLTEMRDSTKLLPNGRETAVTTWSYQPNKDSPSLVTDPEGVATSYVYNQWGLDSLSIAPNGHITRFDYVPNGSLVGLVRGVVDSNVAVYDSGTGTEVTRTLRTGFGFNALGNVVSDTSPMGRIRKFDRDSRQLVWRYVDPAGYRTHYSYDQLNRMRTQSIRVDSAGSIPSLFPADSGATGPLTTTWTYVLDALTQVADPRGVVQSQIVDRMGRVIVKIDDFGSRDSVWFNAAGQVDSTRDRLGKKVRYQYDVAGRLIKKEWEARDEAQADSVTYVYDFSDRDSVLSSTGRSITRYYYADGLLKSEESAGAGHFRSYYAYDKAGRRTYYTIGVKGSTTYSDSIAYYYNSSGALRRMDVRWRNPAGDTLTRDSVHFAWDALGRRDTVTFKNGLSIRMAYDEDGAMRALCSTHSAASYPNDYVFHTVVHHPWIDLGGRVRKTSSVGVIGQGQMCAPGGPYSGPSTEENTYDVRGQLLSQGNGGYGWVYRYDGSGNMIRRQYGQLSNPVQDDKQYFMTANHNRVDSTQSRGGFYARYTFAGDGSRLAEFAGGNTLITATLYDGLGRTQRLYEHECTGTLEGTVCNTNGYASWRSCGYDPVGRMDHPCQLGANALGYDGHNVVRTQDDSSRYAWSFVHGPGTDDPLLGYYPGASKTHAYFITDGNGRLYAVGDKNGVSLFASGSQSQIDFQDYGGQYSGAIRHSTTFGSARFNSKPGLSFFRNRFYDQSTGRWTQEDPIGLAGGVNLYQFSGNNPVAYTDPFGLSPEDCKKVKCPSITVIQNNPTVRAAGEVMLKAAMGDDAERGAYLFNGPKGTIVVGEVKVGKPGAGTVDLGPAPDNAIGSIHTHQPIRGANGVTFPGGAPSGDDAALVRANNIHGVVEETDKRHFQPYQWGGAYYTVERKPPVEP